MQHRFLLSLFLVFALLLSACQEQEPQVLKNVKYGAHDRNIMDIYLPKGRNKKTPFIVLIHPGAWMSGDKEILSTMADSLFQNGIAVANINTRFTSDSTDVSVILEDIDSVFRYCKLQSETWHTRNNDFAIGGSSSGGHLSLMYAYTRQSITKITAVIALATPGNVADTAWLHAMVEKDITDKVGWMCGKQYVVGTAPDSAFYKYSPIYNIRDVPTLLFHGDKDDVVPYWQAEKMLQALQNRNVPSKLFTLKGLGHVIGYQDPQLFAREVQEMKQWLFKYN